jgi:hypothetical protein
MAGSDPVGFRLRVTLKAKKKEQLLSAPSLNSISSQTIRAFLRVLEMEVPPGWTREGPRIGQQAEVTFRANASVGAKQVKRFSGQLWSAVSRG